MHMRLHRMLLYTGFLAECFVADGDMDTVTYSFGHPLASCMIHIYININTDVFFVHSILLHDPVLIISRVHTDLSQFDTQTNIYLFWYSNDNSVSFESTLVVSFLDPKSELNLFLLF